MTVSSSSERPTSRHRVPAASIDESTERLQRLVLRARHIAYSLTTVGALAATVLTADPHWAAVAPVAAAAAAAGRLGDTPTQRVRAALAADALVSPTLWWLLGPVAGVDFILFYVIAVGATLLPRRQATLLSIVAVIGEISQIPLHVVSTRTDLPLFHPSSDIASGEFFAGVVVRTVFLAATAALFVTLATVFRRLQRARDDMIASVAHELRTPLTTVIGYAELLAAGEVRIDDSESRDLAQLIADDAIAVGAVVDDLIVAARTQLGGLVLSREPVPLLEIVTEVTESMADRIAIESGADGDAVALADRGRVRQIIRNLVVNAAQHGGTRCWVELSSAPLPTLRVCDDGPGVPPDRRDALFEHGRAPRSGGTVTERLGVGLVAAHDLARLMGGELSYDRRGSTSVFTLTLPAV